MKYDRKQDMREEGLTMKKIARYPVAGVIAIVPLIMRAHIYEAGLNQYPWFNTSSFEVDIFLYYKGVMLIGLASLMLLLLPYFVYQNREELKGEYWFYPLFGYGLLSLLSTIFSQFPEFGWKGIYEQQESVWVLLAYVITTFFTYFTIRSEDSIGFFIKVILLLAFVTTFIGVSQLIGRDFFETDFAKALMVPSAMEEEYGFRENMHFKFSGSGNHQVYLTLYNPNYVGVFSALLFPILSSLSLGSKEMRKKILWGSLAILNFIIAMGSGSKTFLGSFVVSGVLGIFIYRKHFMKGIRLVLSFLLLLVILTSGYFYMIRINPVDYVKNALNTKENENRIEGLKFYVDRAELVYNKELLELSLMEKEGESPLLVIKNQEGKELKYIEEKENEFKIGGEAYRDVRFGVYEYGEGENLAYTILVTTPEGLIRIGKKEEGYFFLTSTLKEDEIVNAPAAVIVNHDAFASGRGYIWSRTFPLLKKYLFLGSGADTFLLAFPQNDYIGKLNGGFGSMMISKPHNMYLQIAVQTGMLSLICFLLPGLLFVLKGMNYFSRTEMNSKAKLFGASLVMAIAGYLVSGIFNDSVVAVAPLYWVFLGMGYGILFYLKRGEVK